MARILTLKHGSKPTRHPKPARSEPGRSANVQAQPGHAEVGGALAPTRMVTGCIASAHEVIQCSGVTASGAVATLLSRYTASSTNKALAVPCRVLPPLVRPSPTEEPGLALLELVAPDQVLGSRRGKKLYTQRRNGFTGHAAASPSARAREREVAPPTFLRCWHATPVVLV